MNLNWNGSMRLRKILKKNKDGSVFLEISSDLVTFLETVLGMDVIQDSQEVWIYNKDKQTCTLANVAKADCARIKDAIRQISPSNSSPNREP